MLTYNGGKKKKFLAVDGPEASKVIRCLLNFIDSSFAEQCSDNIEVSSDKCQCTGVEMEGVKLDIVILEAKFNKQSDALEKLHNEMASLISKPAHLGESFTESTQNGEDIPTECLQNDKIQRLEADIAILVRGRNSEVNELNNIIDTLNKKSELIEASNVALKHEIVGFKMLKSSNHCNDMGNCNSEQCDHQSLDLINQGTKQKQMQKYGNRTQSLVNNPEGCLNDKAPMYEVSMVSIVSIEIADERVSEAEQHNITNNLPTTITDNNTIIIADECVSEVDKHNITNNMPATIVNNTIIMTDEREWLGHLPLIEAPNPVPSKNLLYESTFNHTFRSRYNPEAPHQQFHKNKYNNQCIRKGQNFKRPVIHRNNPIMPHFRWYQTNHHPPLRSERLTQSLEWETYLDFVHQMTTPYMHGRQKLTQFF